MTRRLLVGLGAAAFFLGDWLLDRLCARVDAAQEPFRRSVDEMLLDPPTYTWE